MQKSINIALKKIMPELKSVGLKGQNGRIGVIGGSYEFTGAPFYSAISALKAGGDLAHIFCSKAASSSIKSYSPEIIVHPVFVSKQEACILDDNLSEVHGLWLDKIRSWQKAINAWVIGPGLGRDPYMHKFFPFLIKNIGKDKIVVFDADGIYYLTQYPELLDHLRGCKTIITPNRKQIGFLKPFLKADIKNMNIPKSSEQISQLPTQFQKLHNFTLVVKGQQDLVLGRHSYVVRTPGGSKRCGGIGDILAGVTSVCAMWNFQLGPVLAAKIVKLATRKAFQKEGRGLTAPSIIHELSSVIKDFQNQQFD